MSFKWTRWLLLVVFVAALSAWSAPAFGQKVVSNTYINRGDDALDAGIPVTFSRIGANGDFTKGITPVISGLRLPAQVDVLRRAPDGSIRHALVSFVLPNLPAGGRVKIDWHNAKPADPPPFKKTERLAKGDIDLTLVLTTSDGKVLTSRVGPLVRGDRPLKGVKVLHDGPVMKEYEIWAAPVDANGKADPQIDVVWRLRFFTGEHSVRVSAIVESCKDRRAGARPPMFRKFKGVKLLSGGKTLYEQGPYIQFDQTRYRLVVWTNGQLEDIERRPNYPYWVKGKFVPLYRWTSKAKRDYKNMTPQKVDTTFAEKGNARSKPKRKQGMLESGIIFWHMPRGGSRWDINPYPAWAVAYLLSGGEQTYKRILHADGNGAGAFYMHIRHKGMPGYNIYAPDAPRNTRIDRYSIPGAVRPNLEPDYAHAPSLGYISYLMTGDKYYGEELSFWASYQMGQSWKQMARSFAWSFRQVVDAAFIQPDDNPLQKAFSAGVEKSLKQMSSQLLTSNRRVHSPPFAIYNSSGRMDWINAKRCSTWMYAWVVWSLGNAADKGFPKAGPVRNWAAEYIVGFYTSKDEFKAPDGKTYTFDPNDAMSYSMAVSLHEYEIYNDKNGVRRVRLGKKKIKNLDNYGEIWYWTKVNSDNMFGNTIGLKTDPDANGVWPLRKDGWGHGMYNWGTQKRWWAWHRYGAWVGLVAAVEGDVPNAKEAWKTMTSLAGYSSYGYEMVPRKNAQD